MLSKVVNRLIGKIGRDIEHTYYVQDGENDYGEVWTSNTETLTGRINRSTTIVQERNEHSAAIDVDAVIYLRKKDADNVTGDGGDGASEFRVDGQTYIAVQVDDQDSGLIHVDCERQR